MFLCPLFTYFHFIRRSIGISIRSYKHEFKSEHGMMICLASIFPPIRPMNCFFLWNDRSGHSHRYGNHVISQPVTDDTMEYIDTTCHAIWQYLTSCLPSYIYETERSCARNSCKYAHRCTMYMHAQRCEGGGTFTR